MSAPSLPQLQSVFAPAGETAARITSLSWVLIIGAALIFIAVMGLLGWAIRAQYFWNWASVKSSHKTHPIYK